MPRLGDQAERVRSRGRPKASTPPPARQAPKGGLLRGAAGGAAIGAVGGAIDKVIDCKKTADVTSRHEGVAREIGAAAND